MLSAALTAMLQRIFDYLKAAIGARGDHPQRSDPQPTHIPPIIPAASRARPAAELLLLSHFKSASSADTISRADQWTHALGMSPSRAIKKLLKEGLLDTAPLERSLQANFNAVQLKALAKEKGLPVSGTKKTLAERLATTSQDIATLLEGQTFLTCTPSGLSAVEQFETQTAAAKQAAQNASLTALQAGRLREACLAVAHYESHQVFSRGIGMNWATYGNGSEFRVLQLLFSRCPAQIRHYPPDRILMLRIAAGMIHLWGLSNPSPWLLPFQADPWPPEVAARMLLFYAQHFQRVEELKAARMTRAVVMGCDLDQCPECRKQDGKVYRFDKLPDIPFAKCTCPDGCRCMMRAEV